MTYILHIRLSVAVKGRIETGFAGIMLYGFRERSNPTRASLSHRIRLDKKKAGGLRTPAEFEALERFQARKRALPRFLRVCMKSIKPVNFNGLADERKEKSGKIFSFP